MFREVYELHPDMRVAYNLTNALVASAGSPQRASDWLDHQEHTREQRAEARRLFWVAARDTKTPQDTQTQAWTDPANQFTNSILVRAGLLNKDGEVVTNPDCDEMFRDHEGLAAASSASIAGKIAFGPSAGRHVTKVGSGFGYYEETPLAKGRLCYSVNGS